MTVSTFETNRGAVSVERVGDGPDLVMLHSLLSDRHVFDPVVPALAERWRVNLVDLPGFGATGPAEVGIDNYADVVGALLESGEFDPSTTAVLGNGLGAFVALGAAVRHGDRFDRLVLVGCGATFPDGATAAFTAMAARVDEGGMGAVMDVAVRRIFSEDFLAAHPELEAERREVLERTDPAAFRTACLSLVGLDYRAAVGSITNPTLVVVGSDDLATPPAMGRDLADRIPGAGYIELPGIAHAPQLQDPGGFLAAVGSFLGMG